MMVIRFGMNIENTQTFTISKITIKSSSIFCLYAHDDIKEWTGMNTTTATKASKERTFWKILICDVTSSSTTEGRRK